VRDDAHLRAGPRDLRAPWGDFPGSRRSAFSRELLGERTAVLRSALPTSHGGRSRSNGADGVDPQERARFRDDIQAGPLSAA
jgi:hypothetical protein